MPNISEIIGGVLKFAIPKPPKKVVEEPRSPKEAICADMLIVYEWLMKYKGQAPFFCLMLQEEFESSFFLGENGEPVIFFDWGAVEHERNGMGDPRVWILEFEGVPN